MIRYPGSKEKIADAIIAHFPDRMMLDLWKAENTEYREPFFGGGAIGFFILNGLRESCRVWLNDKDSGIVRLWKAVYEAPDELRQLIRTFVPSVDLFYKYQEEDGRRDIDPVESGFRKLALHMMSFSGLGFMAGGPLGGRGQSSEYNVDCRWNAERLDLQVVKRHNAMRRLREVRITCGDFAKVIDSANRNCFVYADPPYFEKGGQLYKHNMSDDDHARLSDSMRRCRCEWVLSYDDHPKIRELYKWARFTDVHMTYTMAKANGARRKNREVIITPNASVEAAA